MEAAGYLRPRTGRILEAGREVASFRRLAGQATGSMCLCPDPTVARCGTRRAVASGSASTACGQFSLPKWAMDRWRSTGGEGAFGCPVIKSQTGPVANFKYGAIRHSPNFGAKNLVVSAYYKWTQDRSGTSGAIHVQWYDMAPFHYDEFLIRWDRNGQNVGQAETDFGGSQGRWTIPIDRVGSYRVIVEGCDGKSSHSCKQCWTEDLFVEVAPPEATKF